MAKIIERLGLDWFVILVGKPAFEDAKLPYPETSSDIRDKFGNLDDDDKLNDAVAYCTDLFKREENRSDKVESKAFALIGINGIAIGFITGFAALLLDRAKIDSSFILGILTVLYILIVISVIWTIYLAVRVVVVSDYRFTNPSANDIFALSNTSLSRVKRERAVALFYSFVQNNRVVNRKATFLGGAQLWFRNSIVLLLALTLLLAVYIPFKSLAQSTGVSTPTPEPSATMQPTVEYTATPQPAPTTTVAVSPATPTVTISSRTTITAIAAP